MMKRSAIVLGLWVGAAAGCGAKDPTVAHLDFADAKLTIDQADGVHHELTLAPNGAVRWDGEALITIGKNGVLRAGKQVIATIDKHGSVTISGQPTNLAVLADGTFQLDG